MQWGCRNSSGPHPFELAQVAILRVLCTRLLVVGHVTCAAPRRLPVSVIRDGGAAPTAEAGGCPLDGDGHPAHERPQEQNHSQTVHDLPPLKTWLFLKCSLRSELYFYIIISFFNQCVAAKKKGGNFQNRKFTAG